VAALLPLKACHNIDETKIFDYPVTIVDMPEVTGNLSPEQVSDLNYPTTQFYMMGDSLLFEYLRTSDTFFSFVSIDSGDTLANVCRKGRGPDEVLLPAFYFDVYDGFAHIVDSKTAYYHKLNLKESLERKMAVMDNSFHLEGKSLFTCVSCHTLKDKLVCLDSRVNNPDELSGTPYFSVFDLNDGHHLTDYHIFGEIPLEQKPYMKVSVQNILSVLCTSNRSADQLFFAHYLTPQIAFLDCDSGEVRGIRFGREHKMNLKKPIPCFRAVCSDDERIFLLYIGRENGEKPADTRLMVLDWNGGVQGFFQLDGPYYSIAKSDSALYLGRGGMPNKLFRLPLDIIIANCR